MIITAYIPLSKNAGIKLLTAIFALESVLLYLAFHDILGIAFSFILQWCIRWYLSSNPSNDSTT
jgi:hypothetical protein